MFGNGKLSENFNLKAYCLAEWSETSNKYVRHFHKTVLSQTFQTVIMQVD